MKTSLLPPNFVKCLSPSVRKELGVLTPEEALAKSEIKSERKLQGMIVNLLRLKGIEPLWHRTDRKSHATVGWPDITFAITIGGPSFEREFITFAVGLEVKLPGQSLSKEQSQMWVRLITPPNNWKLKIIHSIDEAITNLRELGIT